jgi:hypothetical protein
MNEFIRKGDENLVAALGNLRYHVTPAKVHAAELALQSRERRSVVRNQDYGATNYIGIDYKLVEIIHELDKSFFQKSWGRARTLTKKLLEDHFEQFRNKGDANLVTALVNLRNHAPTKSLVIDVREALHERQRRRILLERGLPDGTQVALGSRARQAANTPSISMIPPNKLMGLTQKQLRTVTQALSKSVVPVFSTEQERSMVQIKEAKLAKLSSVTEKSNTNIRVPAHSGTVSLPVDQYGGWSPSLMSSFAVNGMRLLPVAGYMGYKMYKNSRKAKKVSRKTRKNR